MLTRTTGFFLRWLALGSVLLPAAALAQIPMPSGIPNPFDEHATAARKPR